ncbi:hypothetical protein [Rudanella lutea]|uniref:hypothetical protein n=1 Tax=Rudanella lutea TaxID=451374 RepID=UPI00037DA9C3|nr:hypothetical protein [Rudanella lutea]
MLYYTQVIYIQEGKESTFHTFEDNVLPLIERHNGELLYRVRPDATAVVATRMGYPYEIHLVSFPSKADFERYRDDPERQQYLSLKVESVEKAILWEGHPL